VSKQHEYDPGCRCKDCCREKFAAEYPKAQRACNHFLFDVRCMSIEFPGACSLEQAKSLAAADSKHHSRPAGREVKP
jgi:hypothetical protein